MSDKCGVVARVCEAISGNRLEQASAALLSGYPFTPLTNAGRRYSARQCMQVFVRDGFIDRYTGNRLVFPGTLRLLSILLPKEFPFHNNWKTDACHFAFYELFPTIDHLIPVSRGGSDREENWVSTSMLRNAAKANFTLRELGWRLVPPGDVRAWDGLTGWFLEQAGARSEISTNAYLRRWVIAANLVVQK